MKSKGLWVLFVFGMSYSSFAQAAGEACCVKQIPAKGGSCIFHALLPNSGDCPGGFNFVAALKSPAACPMRGAKPHQASCLGVNFPDPTPTPSATPIAPTPSPEPSASPDDSANPLGY